MNRHPGILLSLLAVGILATVHVQPVQAAWSLVWADEFNGTTLDPNNWTADSGNGCPSLCGWGNNELQSYSPANVSVTGGNLVLTAERSGNTFTSGKVLTRGKQTFLYGRVEMRAKIPQGGGMWPAFWMLPQDDAYGTWASSGEIDIMEASNTPTYVNGTIHYGGQWPNNTYSGGSYSGGVGNFADDFHTYSIEWEPDEIRWYVDGNLYAIRTSSQWYSDGAPGNSRAPFDQDFFVILNAAVGGNYTGCTDPGCVTASFPQQYLIDYVRVYEDIPNSLPFVTITSPSAGSTVPAGTVTIEAFAVDSDGSVATVEFYNGAAYLGADTTEPYSFDWTGVTDGCYQVVARVIDDLGGTNQSSVDFEVGAGCGQAPYASVFEFPTRIDLEDYDLGGEGVAFHDVDASNNGGQYRPSEAVDIETCSDVGGGYNVGWIAAGEWLEYSVDVPWAGSYAMEARVASGVGGGSFRLEFGGLDKTGTLTVPPTSGWQNWTTISFNVELEAGLQTMRFFSISGEYNINHITVVSVPTAAPPGLADGLIENFEAYPNPFNPRTTIRYELSSESEVDLLIFDAQGRMIRTLSSAELSGVGSHERTWDGTDDSGRVVAAGVYYCRLEAGEDSRNMRVVLLK